MPNTREKLIELIDQKQVYGIDIEQPRKHEIQLFDNDELADHLIANGVEIPVRCKDCMNYINLSENGRDYRCSIFCGCYDRPYPTEADDYCSYGVRKDDGNFAKKCDGVKVFCNGDCDNCASKETWDKLKSVFNSIYDDEMDGDGNG